MPILDKNNAQEVARYEKFVQETPFRALTQDLGWKDVKDDWGNEQVYVERDGEIIAAMSLLIKKVPGGYSLLYAPRGPLCDLEDIALVNELVSEAQPLAKKHKAFALKMDPEQLYTEELDAKYKKAGYQVRNEGMGEDDLIQPRYNMIVRLKDEDADSLMLKFRPRVRSKIRKAAREGVEIDSGTTDEYLKTFFDLYDIMGDRNGITTRDYHYFEKIREAFPKHFVVYRAKHEEDYLAAAVLLNYEGKQYYLYAGSSNEKRKLNASHLLNYQMMVDGIEMGAEQYDLGGVFVLDGEEDGLFNFKNGFCQTDGVTTYIGEIDKVYKPLLYKTFVTLVPKLQEVKKKIAEKKNN
ncbi:methicillin resistance protein [Lysinibacillus alkalisoli]|uniref:Lipid II:glycine glycyltransferase n=1 Tax=Lysinibacillus alkalisoli TaxID=1911548 RepID=A0A917GAG1_9BACI|nr:peptidoglycan bridge formation glycyltransferase FemA/FemB family protein [Lysinibacillus alkalisoli]GGG33989.1 methicillin resistance protein [Lysinibacillus alkalisoli]